MWKSYNRKYIWKIMHRNVHSRLNVPRKILSATCMSKGEELYSCTRAQTQDPQNTISMLYQQRYLAASVIFPLPNWDLSQSFKPSSCRLQDLFHTISCYQTWSWPKNDTGWEKCTAITWLKPGTLRLPFRCSNDWAIQPPCMYVKTKNVKW